MTNKFIPPSSMLEVVCEKKTNSIRKWQKKIKGKLCETGKFWNHKTREEPWIWLTRSCKSWRRSWKTICDWFIEFTFSGWWNLNAVEFLAIITNSIDFGVWSLCGLFKYQSSINVRSTLDAKQVFLISDTFLIVFVTRCSLNVLQFCVGKRILSVLQELLSSFVHRRLSVII